jgi:ABC-type nitrate/sulfonate/bicarbonate transport system substrate-binding protein
MMLNRRHFVRNLAAGAASAPLVSRLAFAKDLAKVRLQFGWIANVEYAGVFVGMEKGYFAGEGIEVSYSPGGPNAPDPLVVVAAKSADFGFTSWLQFLDALDKGNDFIIVGTLFQQSPVGILSLAKKPILKPQDIVGKKILAQSPAEKTAIDATLALAGLPKDWTMATTGFSPEPLLAGDGDGYTAFGTNQTITLEKMGLKNGTDFFFVSFDSLGLHRYDDIIFAQRSYVEANRATVVAFLRGFVKGLKENAKDLKYGAELVVKKYGVDYGLDVGQQTRENELQQPLLYPIGNSSHPLLTVDKDVIGGVLYAGAKASGRTTLPDVDKIADYSLAVEANKDA